ncbi:YciI family protein [Georgenia alba]|uniref:YciI family protein n=1 Tax=Georgenia alba TaxID=2233858 RepID=A0ABW2Q9R1_9MICO
MTQYMLTNPHDSAEEPTMADMDPAVLEALLAKTMAFLDDLRAQDALVFAGGLHPPSSAKTVDATGETPTVENRPFVEADQYVGGFWVIDVANEEAAVEWATRASEMLGGPIEVRAFQEIPDA